MQEYKQVPIKTLKKGDKFSRLTTPESCHFASYEILEISGAFVKLKVFDKHEETISTEGCFAEVPLTDEEYRAKYEQDAAKIVEILRQPVSTYSQGYHEMDNSWVQTDAYDFAAVCKNKDMSIIGWFPLPDYDKKDLCDGYVQMDIGIIGQDNYPHDHDTYWCHASKKWIDHLIEDWDEAHQK